MKLKDITGLVLADIHLGACDINQTYKEINFLRDYIKDRYYNFIIIAGDFWDRKIYSNEEYIVIANKLILTLLSRCDKLRIINGTRSHDNNQNSIFKQYEENMANDLLKKDIDFKIINTVEEELLFDNINVLYVPEEYMYDQKEYYADTLYSNKEYNYIFGHGIIEEGMVNATRNIKITSEKRKKAPIFKVKLLEDRCIGQVYFGHYHTHTEITDNVFYVGSFSRYKFGEEEDKGFYEISTDGEIYENNFIHNTSTQTYVQIAYSFKSKIFNQDINLPEELKLIINKKNKSGIDKLKIIFNIPDEYPNSEFFINVVNDIFRDLDDFKIEITNGYITTKRNVNKELLKDMIDKYHYVFEKNVPIEDTISSFIKDKYNKDISSDKIKKYFNFKAVDLLSE